MILVGFCYSLAGYQIIIVKTQKGWDYCTPTGWTSRKFILMCKLSKALPQVVALQTYEIVIEIVLLKVYNFNIVNKLYQAKLQL